MTTETQPTNQTYEFSSLYHALEVIPLERQKFFLKNFRQYELNHQKRYYDRDINMTAGTWLDDGSLDENGNGSGLMIVSNVPHHPFRQTPQTQKVQAAQSGAVETGPRDRRGGIGCMSPFALFSIDGPIPFALHSLVSWIGAGSDKEYREKLRQDRQKGWKDICNK